jgi:hypothetical protein
MTCAHHYLSFQILERKRTGDGEEVGEDREVEGREEEEKGDGLW